MFAELPKGLHKSRPTDHPIVVEETQATPAHRLYRMPEADQEEIKRLVEELVAAWRIRPLTSPFGASAMLLYKKDKSRRMVIDYRALYKLTRKDKYSLPRIDEMLDKLATGRYFTKMDLSSGFHQISIRKGDEPKTAFQTRYGSFEWTDMPFVLTNAPETFQRTMAMPFFRHDRLYRHLC